MPATMMNELVQHFGEYPSSMIREGVRSAKPLREQWKRVVAEATRARCLPELHRVRDEYRAYLESRIRLLETLRTLATTHPQAPESTELDELEQVLDDLRKFRDELFSRWDTLDDFYKVAVKALSLSADELSRIAKKNPPPQSWYEETINPFE